MHHRKINVVAMAPVSCWPRSLLRRPNPWLFFLGVFVAVFFSSTSLVFAWPRPLCRHRLLLASLLCTGQPEVSHAEVAISPTELAPRNARKDEEFAKGMAYGMIDYERAVSKKKRALFAKLWGLLPPNPVVVEVGIGSFPNALYFGSRSAPHSMDIVGVDPNGYMEPYALANAKKVGLLDPERQNSVRFVKGIAEALPLQDKVADAAALLQLKLAVLKLDVPSQGRCFFWHPTGRLRLESYIGRPFEK